jgi:hypothetical protein
MFGLEGTQPDARGGVSSYGLADQMNVPPLEQGLRLREMFSPQHENHLLIASYGTQAITGLYKHRPFAGQV